MKKEFNVAIKAMIEKDGKYLILVRDRNDNIAAGEHDTPGGVPEYGEKPEETLRREVMEESGLEVEIIRPLKVWTVIKEKYQTIGITYLCRYKSGEVKLSEEHESFEWVTGEQILEGDYPAWLKEDVMLLKKVKKG